jgi:hypothetical protein
MTKKRRCVSEKCLRADYYIMLTYGHYLTNLEVLPWNCLKRNLDFPRHGPDIWAAPVNSEKAFWGRKKERDREQTDKYNNNCDTVCHLYKTRQVVTQKKNSKIFLLVTIQLMCHYTYIRQAMALFGELQLICLRLLLVPVNSKCPSIKRIEKHKS